MHPPQQHYLQVLADGLRALAAAGWMPGGSPAASVSFGNQVIERLLQLRDAGWAAAAGCSAKVSGPGMLPVLPALATAVEALSELACVDKLAGIALANMVVELVLAAEAAGKLDLAQVARCVASLAVICSTSPGAMSTRWASGRACV